MNETAISVFAESCPLPYAFTVEGCKDAARVELPPVGLGGLGRIVQLDAVIRNVCPGKQVAVSIQLNELGPDNQELPRGVKHLLIPAHNDPACRDVILKCVQFSLPEALDATGNTDSICNPRKYHTRVIANYVDTDYACCEAEAAMI